MSIPFANNYDLTSKGWTELKLENDLLASQQNLIKLKNQLIEEINFRNLKTSDLEINKAILRSIVRYSSEGEQFVSSYAKYLCQQDNIFADYYFTMPYIILHLPNDLNEGAGEVHVDTIFECGEMFTSWTPINAEILNYPPLRFYEKSHLRKIASGSSSLIIQIAKRVWSKSLRISGIKKISPSISNKSTSKKIPGILNDLYIDKHSSYFWKSNLYHNGNPNSGSITHAALVLRVSEKPLYYEPTVNGNSIAKRKLLDTLRPSYKDILGCFIVADITHVDILNSELTNLVIFIEKAYKAKEQTNKIFHKHLSFTFALIAQRTKNINLSIQYDLLSIVYGTENIVSLERIMKISLAQGKANFMFQTLKNYHDYNSYQEKVLLGKFNISVADEGGILNW